MKQTNLKLFSVEKNKNNKNYPFFASPVIAGFPSPAEDFLEKPLDLNKHLIKHPAATFFVKVEGSSMRDANIFAGDILVVDRSLEHKDKTIVVAIINGEFTLKRLRIKNKKIFLEAENKNFKAIEITSECDFEIWGIVTYIIHKAR